MLVVIAIAQLMVILDATIVNVALPSMQESLSFSTENLSWVVNAYALAFGGLLLLGGRVGDLLGRRPAFIGGVSLFTLGSLLGGLAQNSGWLLGMRVIQGAGAAIIAPTVLSLIATGFPTEKERNRAFAVFAGVSGAGGAIGLVAGGLLTEWVSWRWVLLVNVPIGVALAVVAPLFIGKSARSEGRFDIGGAITSTGGVGLLVYGFIHASDSGWRDATTIGSFIVAVILLAAFLFIESRTPQPIIPLRLFASRNRSGIYVLGVAMMGSLIGMFFFLTLYFQNVLAYSPLKTGLAFLPLSVSIIVVSGVMMQLIPKIGQRLPLVLGTLLITGSLVWLTAISADSAYLSDLLGPMLLYGLGAGMVFMPMTMVGVSDVETEDTGAASGLLNATQQMGGSLSLAIIITVYSSVTSGATGDKAHVLAKGASAGFWVAVAITVVALALVVLLVRPAENAAMPGMMPGSDAGGTDAESKPAADGSPSVPLAESPE
ncbi:MFS transporter [Streptomyces sp. BBFR51]|uniref:MFS transporter n=1 Tax=Streptomyces sp. BBFR51 TaxID=3372856 RepID=UPI0037DCB22A